MFYIAVAIGFGAWFTSAFGTELGIQYFAGYLVEKSLSVDNLFVFVIIMTTFAVPEKHQHKVLTFGIVLALIMRAVFIALGATCVAVLRRLPAVRSAADLHRDPAVPTPGRGSRRRGQRGGEGRPPAAARHRRLR